MRRDWRPPKRPSAESLHRRRCANSLIFVLYLSLRYSHPKNGAVFVYTFGHAGTASLSQSLAEMGMSPVFAVHFLNPERVRRIPHYPRDVGLILHRAYVQKRRPLKVVSVVRNPIDHAISGFFRERFLRSAGPVPDVVELTEAFVSHVRDQPHDEDWFSAEMKPALGIDVYQEPFDPGTGYSVLRNGAIELLLVRLELGNAERENVVGSFLGVEGFRWRRDVNAARSRSYYPAYKAFQEQAKLPGELLETLTDVPYARHFYSADEIASQIARWT